MVLQILIYDSVTCIFNLDFANDLLVVILIIEV